MPESCIEEVENSMLSATDVTIHFAPIFHHSWINYCLTIRRIHKTEIVPARTCPLGHGVRLSFPCEIISQANIDPFRNRRKRGFPITWWFIFFYFWEFQREIPIRQEPAGDSSREFAENCISFFEYISIEPAIIGFTCRKWLFIFIPNMNQWNRLTPVSLTRENPISEFVIRYLFAESFFFCFFIENISGFEWR